MEAVFDFLMQFCGQYGYPVLFAGVLLESVGIPIPGETAVMVAGLLASKAGGRRFTLSVVMVVTVTAAILGDNLGFWLGRRWAYPRLQRGGRFLFLSQSVYRRAKAYFERYGAWTVFFARFVSGLRIAGALAAGTAGMPWTRFVIANAAGASLWGVTMSLVGYFFGQHWHLVHKWLQRGGWTILGALIVLALAVYAWRRLKSRSAATNAQPGSPDGASDNPEGVIAPPPTGPRDEPAGR